MALGTAGTPTVSSAHGPGPVTSLTFLDRPMAKLFELRQESECEGLLFLFRCRSDLLGKTSLNLVTYSLTMCCGLGKRPSTSSSCHHRHPCAVIAVTTVRGFAMPRACFKFNVSIACDVSISCIVLVSSDHQHACRSLDSNSVSCIVFFMLIYHLYHASTAVYDR